MAQGLSLVWIHGREDAADLRDVVHVLKPLSYAVWATSSLGMFEEDIQSVSWSFQGYFIWFIEQIAWCFGLDKPSQHPKPEPSLGNLHGP